VGGLRVLEAEALGRLEDHKGMESAMSFQATKTDDEKSSQLRSSGYVSRFEEYWYDTSH
jgi:hypothetical protein